MKTPVRYPQGGVWPEQMQADMAAAFCDEPSVEAFRRKCGSVYPEGNKLTGTLKWHRAALELSLAKIHKLASNVKEHGERVNVSELI